MGLSNWKENIDTSDWGVPKVKQVQYSFFGEAKIAGRTCTVSNPFKTKQYYDLKIRNKIEYSIT